MKTLHKPGDRVYRYVWTGGEHHDIQELTVVKTNPKTYRVRTKYGNELVLPHHHIEGPIDWDDEEPKHEAFNDRRTNR
jgi:hypothetical protein